MTHPSTTFPSQVTGILLVAAGALGFSAAIIFARSIEGLNVAIITLFRATSAFLFFSLLTLKHRHVLDVRHYRQAVPYLIGLGVTMGTTAMFYVYAVRTTTAANAVLLNNTAPLYVALLGPSFLREPRPRYTWPSLALAMVGIVLITGMTDLTPTRDDWTGIGAGIISGLTLGLTLMISRRLGQHVDGLIQGWWSTGVTALIVLPVALFGAWTPLIPNLHLLIMMGVFAFGLPYLLYFLGLRRVNAQVGSLVALLEPVSGVLIGALLYQEVPSMLGGMGILLILTSIYLISQST